MAIKRYDGGMSVLGVRARNRARERYWSEYDREAHPCQGCKRADVPLEVHHADGDCLNNHPLNLVALCRRCHKARHKRERTNDRLKQMRADLETLQA